jgi:cell division transport system permease protein
MRLVRVIARNASRYLVGSAVRNWLRNFGSTAPALGSMTLLLLLVALGGMAGLVARNAYAAEAKDASVLHIYLSDNATAEQVAALESRLRTEGDVRSVVYVSKEEALARAQHRPGLPDLANAAEENPFPASLDVQVDSIDRVAAVDSAIRRQPGVDTGLPTSYDPGAYRRFQQVLLGAAVVGIAFLILLTFIAVTVTANSIRAAILARGDEIGIMLLVGAPHWMVRGPFVIEGALTGVAAGFVAGLLAIVVSIVAIRVGATSFAQVAPGLTVQLALVTALILVVVGPLLGSLSSLASLRRQMES